MSARAIVTVMGACLAANAFAAPSPKLRVPPTPAQLEDPCLDDAVASPADAAAPVSELDAGAAAAPTCQHRALDAFATALAAQRAGAADHPLRISWFGDSLTADDQITGAVRTRLQALVGDGGPGFVYAVAPHPFCAHRAVARGVIGPWLAYGISTVQPADRLLGLGGTAETDGGGTIRLVPTSHDVRSVDVHYLAQPHGGRFEIVADGAVLATVPTADDHKHGEFSQVAVPAATRAIELRAAGRVRLFGASLEAARGAVVDNLGVVNATAKSMRHNLDEHWRNQLAHRDADLIVIMLGTNEAEWLHAGGVGMAEHERIFGELLADVRTASPNASCLVVSPLDQLDWRVENMPPRTSVPAMVAAQRRAAVANGCAFWDAYQWMGGKGASRRWYTRGLIVKDFQHPTTEGADLIGAALYAGLVGNDLTSTR